MKKLSLESLIKNINSAKGQEFLEHHKNQDHTSLLFKYGTDKEKKELISQLILRKKLANKLPDWTLNTKILFPLTISTEQASSQATAELKSKLISGEFILDITGGLGVDIFYMSRSFKKAVYIERNPDLVGLVKYNFSVLGNSKVILKTGDGLEALTENEPDLIYADPARRDEKNKKVFALSDYEPNLLAVKEQLLRNGRKILIKTSPMLDISQALNELGEVTEVWIISHKNECKEVNYLMRQDADPTVLIRTFNIETGGNLQQFDFEAATDSEPILAEELGEYLYEPNASIQKGKGVDALSQSTKLNKLHPNSNLLTGDDYPSFPGRKFRISDVLKPYHKSLKNKRFNVISRNYPDKASVIEKKLKLKSAKRDYLVATRKFSGEYIFIVCQFIEPV